MTKAKYVENIISYRDLIAFTCTSSQDTDLLVQKLRLEMQLGVNIITSVSEEGSVYVPEMDINQLRYVIFFTCVL